MNKFFTALLVALGVSATAFSQTKGTTQFGITVGYNASTVNSSGYTNSDYRSGFNAGVSVEQYFSESWSIKGKLLYNQKGWNSGYFGEVGDRTNFQLDYFTVPVLANWHFGRTKNWYLNFGPYIGFLLNAKETAGNEDVKDFFNTTDAGLDLGIGVKFPVSEKARFYIELDGQAGIADIGKGGSGSSVRNSTSAINIGFTF
jgi:hypothetical protein